MSDPFQVLLLTLERPFRCVEEFSLTAEKVRLDRRDLFSSGIVEVPIRYLDATWVVEKGSSRARCLFYAVAMTGLAGYLVWVLLGGHGEHRLTGMVGIAVVWAIVTPFCLWLWRTGRFNAIVFPSLHPQFAAFAICRDPEKELEIMEFADAMSERIRTLSAPKQEEEQ